jgi:hypothetical protein
MDERYFRKYLKVGDHAIAKMDNDDIMTGVIGMMDDESLSLLTLDDDKMLELFLLYGRIEWFGKITPGPKEVNAQLVSIIKRINKEPTNDNDNENDNR